MTRGATTRDATENDGKEKLVNVESRILDDLLGGIVDVVVAVDDKGVVRYISPAVRRLLGVEPADVVGRAITELLHPDDGASVIGTLLRRRGSSTNAVEIRLRNGAGEWCAVTVTTFRGPSLEAQGLYAVVLRDAAERGTTLDALRQRLAFEDLLTRVSASFIERPSFELSECLDAALADVGSFARVDRVVLCLLHEDRNTVELVNEWVASGISSRPQEHRTISQDLVPQWLKILRKPDVIYVPRVADLGSAWHNDRAFINTLDIQSLLVAPVLQERGLIGFVAFDSVRTERMWSDDHVSVLTSLAGIVSQALSRSDAEQRFGLAFTNAPLGMALHRPDGLHLQVNPAYCELLGVESDEVLAKRLLDFVHPDDHAIVKEQHRRILKRETDRLFVEIRFPRPDGSVVWGHVHAAPVRSTDGNLRYTVTHIEDVTVRHVREAELRTSEERYRTLVENSPNVIMRFDRHTGATYVSHALEELTGVPASRVVGRTNDLFAGGEEGLRWREAIESVFATGRRLDREWELTLRDQHYWFQSRAVPEFDGEGRIEHVLVVTSDITALKRSEAELAHQALHDPLTGLANRALLLDHLRSALARASRHPGSLVLLFLDLDRFKLVNDSMGHSVGDELLVAVAGRLKGVVRPGDTVARLGGDEFVVLLEDVRAQEEVTEVALRIKRVMADPVAIGTSELFTTTSIGIAIAEPSHDAEGLLRDADSAMYLAKARGRNRFEVFDEALRTEATAKLTMEGALRRAIDLMGGPISDGAGGLEVFFQPEVDLLSGEILGAEALARWHHPTEGLLEADRFIELAEESGLILDLGEWVLQEACRIAGAWQHGAAGKAHFTLRVNLSARQIAQSDIVDTVVRALDEAHLPPEKLCLEITETALMQDPVSALRVLTDLRTLGVSLAVDDFGTGYSSLAYLKRFPVDVLKIDRSFVDGLGDDPEDTAIVTAIVGMAGALGLALVAEGVETKPQLAELVRLGCQRAQGYLFSRPVPVEEFLAIPSPFDPSVLR